MKLKIKKLHPDAKLPSYAHTDDAAMDIFAVERVSIKAGGRATVKTGISMEIPEGYAGFLWDKSSIGIREGIKNIGGLIDAGYRGEIMVGMVNMSDKEYVFEAGHKLVQMVIQKVEYLEIVEADTLNETKRGTGTQGSTGK